MEKRFLNIPKEIDLSSQVGAVRRSGRLQIDPKTYAAIHKRECIKGLHDVYDLGQLLRMIFYIK